jgi:cell wall-associated NlpC family hydrolase
MSEIRDQRSERSAAWAAGYVGIPFVDGGRGRDGLDCWGLVRLVLRERFGAEVPDLEVTGGTCPPAAVGEAAVSELPRWREIRAGQERPGDVVLLRLNGHPTHVGVVVLRGTMLHCLAGCDSCVEHYLGPLWSRRLVGIYRWRGRRA